MATVTKPIALDESLNTTESPSRSVADVLAQELSAVATAIGNISAPSAEDVSYDNSVSGLSATDVQNALDEIVGDIPTVNDGTLTIQQNGTSKGVFTANSASNVTVDINTPTADKKTATDEFTTADGGLLSKCQINLVPVQSGSGDPSPDNVRPISGHTEVDLYNVGKNWIDNTQTPTDAYINNSGVITASGNDRSVICKVSPNTQYTISFYRVRVATGSDDWQVGEYTSMPSIGDSGIRSVRINVSSEGLQKATITTQPTTKYLFIKIANINTTNYSESVATLQVEKNSDATTYEPYNPSSHLYTVQIGSTVYGGYVDLVSGVMVATYALVTYDGSNDESWNYSSAWSKVNTTCFYLNGDPTIYFPSWDYKSFNYCNELKCASRNEIYNNDYLAIGMSGSENNGAVTIRVPSTVTDVTQLRAWLATNPIQATYELATPQTIQLTPQQIETLSGQNNLSTPLSGQSIETDGVEYKELFTFADVKSYVDPYPNAGSHNAIYRGKFLGSAVSANQWSAIQNGTFDDLFIGDYWTINGVNWRIAHFDYWLGVGDTECTDHHAVIVPDTNLYNAKMNSSNTTTGGYYDSLMHGGVNYLVSGSSNLYSASQTVESAFGSTHILTHREVLTNAVSSGNASGWDWYDSSVDLMSEVMVYGTLVWSIGGKGYEVASSKGQFALFRHDISKITNRSLWWLRGVYSEMGFALIAQNGNAVNDNASNSRGVRPCFAIK